ncbi:MAG TPA: DMT family transporter [Jatrophihabitans sp.]|nr:DMT family transporter [Jatrophihabitans sp.]
MSTALGISAALLAAMSFAAGGVLQQRAAARTTDVEALSVGFVASLLRQRLWLCGVALAIASYGLQMLALALQPLTVVQPLLVTEVIVAVPLSARLAGHRLRAREFAGLLLVAGGVAATLWGAAPHGQAGGHGTPSRWLFAVVAVLLAVALLRSAARGRSAVARARLYSGAAALLFALAAAMLVVTVDGLAGSGVGVFCGPAPYGVAAAEVAGMVFIQSAFQAGPLAVAMPVVNWAQPLVAVALGIGVLGESVLTDAGHLGALAIGALGALVGIVVLDGSPRVRAMHAGCDPAPRPAATELVRNVGVPVCALAA